MIKSIPITGLLPSTVYSFSVIGIKSDGSQTQAIPVIISDSSRFTTKSASKPSIPSAPTIKKPTTSKDTDETISLYISTSNTKASGGAIEADVVSYNIYASPTFDGTYSKIDNFPIDKSGDSWAIFQITVTSTKGGTSYGASPYIKISAVSRSGSESDLSSQDRASGATITPMDAFDELFVRDLVASKISTGTLRASQYIQAGSGFKFGNNVDGSSNNGIYINANNYWYDSGKFKVGGSSNYLSWDTLSSTLTVSGTITASQGAIGGWQINPGYISKSYTDTNTGGTVDFRIDSGNDTGFPSVFTDSSYFGGVKIDATGLVSIRSQYNDIISSFNTGQWAKSSSGTLSLTNMGSLHIYKATSSNAYQLLLFDSNEIQSASINTSSPLNTPASSSFSVNSRGGNIIVGLNAGTVASPAFALNTDTMYILSQTTRIYSPTVNIGTSTDNTTVTITGRANISTLNATAAATTTKVTNLNADLLDGLSSGDFLRSNTSDTFTGATLALGSSTDIIPTVNSASNLGNSTYAFLTAWADIAYVNARPQVANTSVGSGYVGSSTAPYASGYIKVLYYNGGSLGSDRNIKNSVSDSDLGLDFINSIRPVKYKFNDGGVEVITNEDGTTSEVPHSGKRWHYGFIAQDIKDWFKSRNLDAGLFAMENPEDDNSMHYIRPEEFLSPIVKSIQELIARNEELSLIHI